MNIKTLQQFIHLANSHSFNKTAIAMHLSPSALTRSIQKLEQNIGEPLFLRDNRHVELTDAGKKLMPVAITIVQEWQQFQLSIRENDRDLTGEIRLFCSVTASFSHLPELLTDFRINYPNIELKLSTGDPAKALEQLYQDKADIVISALPDHLPARLVGKPIGEIPLSVISPTNPNSFSTELQKESPDWQTIPFIIPESGTARDRSNAWFREMKFKPNIYAQTEGHEGIVSMVALGLGVGIAPDVVINNSPVKDKIQRLDVLPIKPFKLGICCQKSQLENPLIQALWQVSQDKFIKT